MSQKRERSINFTRTEVDILVDLVVLSKDILENKKSDAITWQQKEECWKSIEVSFNATSGSTYRTAKHLRTKYEGIKRDTKKKAAMIRADTYRTGGGRSTAPVLTPSELKVKEMILLSVDGMESNFDSDCVPNTVVDLLLNKVPPPHDPVFDNNISVDELVDAQNLNEYIHLPSGELEENKENVEETPVRPVKRTLFDTQDTADLGEASSETVTKWSKWKPSSLRSRRHPALCNPKPKRPYEKVADSRMEITALQKNILEEEYVNKKLQWAFEEEERQRRRTFEEEERQRRWALEEDTQHRRAFDEEERQHRREMRALEKKLLLKQLNEYNE